MTQLRLVLLIVLTACSKKEEAAPDKDVETFFVEAGRRELQTLEKKVAEGTADKFACAAAMANLDKIEPADKPTATKIRTLCEHDIPLAILQKLVPIAEEARKAAPDKISLRECDIDMDMAIETLDKAGTHDDATRALVVRADTACPLHAKTRASRAKRNAAK